MFGFKAKTVLANDLNHCNNQFYAYKILVFTDIKIHDFWS